ncbi:hypothetical protein FIBSPDRAFT_924033 [Athelia psychrophila]|uniref:Uncharacterized protein n=1 Tax=Athelia psychrophila TaxID=1759441 RepID=A0A166X8X0_9AGAM|nr:hypothetical protein FIBSPDRAFT_924033 [Fibularhizoctonia sp. CBS 109695]
MSLPPLSLSCSPLLDYATTHLQLAEAVDSDTNATPLCTSSQFSAEASAPSCTSIAISTISAMSSTVPLGVTAYPSSRTISLFTRSESCASLSEKALPPLPPCSAPITTKEIISIMELLNSFDDDVMKEVARVKENIYDVRELVCTYKTESSTRLDVIAEATAGVM